MSAEFSQLDAELSTVIANHPHLPFRHIKIERGDGRVVLKGVVRSYYHKQMAQETLRRLQGIQTIENQLEVTWS
jgi:osmotically-inducible protein OsmY